MLRFIGFQPDFSLNSDIELQVAHRAGGAARDDGEDCKERREEEEQAGRGCDCDGMRERFLRGAGAVAASFVVYAKHPWLSQGMIAMWLKEGGAADALQQIKHARHDAASAVAMSKPPPPPPITAWIVMDDAELFAGARLCLKQVRITLNPHILHWQLMLPPTPHNPKSAWIRRSQRQNR